LTIAASDSGGGAGIQADLKTFFALGVHGMSAITAITAQSTSGIAEVWPVPPHLIGGQITEVARDIPVAAAKTGALVTGEIVEIVAAEVAERRVVNLVVDPVMFATSGQELLDAPGRASLMKLLGPLCLVLTPNLAEASALTGNQVTGVEEMKLAARVLKDLGPRYVLVKGGHLGGQATDIFYDGESFTELVGRRIDSPNTHGAGCTLSAAIAAYVALGLEAPAAVSAAKVFVTGAIKNAQSIGRGPGPLNQRWNL